jgi:hypothetical protein
LFFIDFWRVDALYLQGAVVVFNIQNGDFQMRLQDVTAKEQFDEYYKVNKLHTVNDKINYLISAMKIRAIQSEGEESPDVVLAGLEESALLGFWKASWQ